MSLKTVQHYQNITYNDFKDNLFLLKTKQGRNVLLFAAAAGYGNISFNFANIPLLNIMTVFLNKLHAYYITVARLHTVKFTVVGIEQML